MDLYGTKIIDWGKKTPDGRSIRDFPIETQKTMILKAVSAFMQKTKNTPVDKNCIQPTGWMRIETLCEVVNKGPRKNNFTIIRRNITKEWFCIFSLKARKWFNINKKNSYYYTCTTES